MAASSSVLTTKQETPFAGNVATGRRCWDTELERGCNRFNQTARRKSRSAHLLHVKFLAQRSGRVESGCTRFGNDRDVIQMSERSQKKTTLAECHARDAKWSSWAIRPHKENKPHINFMKMKLPRAMFLAAVPGENFRSVCAVYSHFMFNGNSAPFAPTFAPH